MQNTLVCLATPPPKLPRHPPKTQVQHSNTLSPAFGVRSNTTTMFDTHSHHPVTGIVFLPFFVDERNSEIYVAPVDLSISIGLFAPRQGQMYREEQRRRRSQYDRGTPGAEFEAHTQFLTGPALTTYPSSPYPAPTNTSYYDNLGYTPNVPVRRTFGP
jgi:hypothetical protein